MFSIVKQFFNKVSATAGTLCGFDGLLHILFSAVIFSILVSIFSLIVPQIWALVISTVITVIIDILKEWIDDKYLNSKFSIKDLICDFIGILIVLIPCIFILI